MSISNVYRNVVCVNISSRMHKIKSVKLNTVHNSTKQECSCAKTTLLFIFPIAETFKGGLFLKMFMSQKWGMSNTVLWTFMNVLLLKEHHLVFSVRR